MENIIYDKDLPNSDEFFKRSMQLNLRALKIWCIWVFLKEYHPFKSVFLGKRFKRTNDKIQEQINELHKRGYVDRKKGEAPTDKIWIKANQCPECNSIDIDWFTESKNHKQCKACEHIFGANILVEADYITTNK